jgi:hypothetical protein
VEWDDYAALTRTIERQNTLEACLATPGLTRKALIAEFLKAPLYSQQYFRSFGTLYTAAYEVARGSVQIIWPSKQVEASFERFDEQDVDVVLLRPVGRYLVKGSGSRR